MKLVKFLLTPPIVAISVFLFVALGAQAAWRIDTYNSKPVLTDDNWTIYLTVIDSGKKTYKLGIDSYSQGNLSYVSGSGELDLTTVEADAGIKITTLARSMMEKVTTLTSVKIPETVTLIDGSCFNGCTELTTVDPFLPGTVKSVNDSAFNGCTKLRGDLVITNDNITVIGRNTFSGTLISSVAFSPKLVELKDQSFNACTNCSRISPMEFPCLKIVGGWLFNPSPIEGDTLTFSSPDFSSVGFGAFTGCRFTNLVFSSSVKTMGGGGGAFGSNPNLETVRCIWRKKGVSVGGSCSIGGFANCPKLTEFTIPFRGSFKMASNVFNGCTSLKDIYFWGTAPTTFENWYLPANGGGYSVYHYVFHCCKSEAEQAWLAHSQSLTDADKERATYPGGRCFGVKPSASYQPNAWFVWELSPYDPLGLMIQVR